MSRYAYLRDDVLLDETIALMSGNMALIYPSLLPITAGVDRARCMEEIVAE